MFMTQQHERHVAHVLLITLRQKTINKIMMTFPSLKCFNENLELYLENQSTWLRVIQVFCGNFQPFFEINFFFFGVIQIQFISITENNGVSIFIVFVQTNVFKFRQLFSKWSCFCCKNSEK